MSSTSRELIGSTIKHYRIESLLGEGGMGAVYKAHDTTLGRPLALKILPAKFLSDADRMDRFVQEAKSASALNHPHVVTIYEIGATEDASRIHYIAMELIDGETLRDKLHHGPLELKKALELMAQVAEGLATAHAAGVVHRDLKPENIMITTSGYAKILDFGLAKLREQEGESPHDKSATEVRKTHPGAVMGTVGYMSPEQAAGRPVDLRSDIFSLGCIVYEAVTGKRPFFGTSSVDTLHRILHADPTPIRDLDPELPSELQRIVRKCLSKDPDERYQSAKDVALDLRELKRELGSQPRLEGAMTVPGRQSRRWLWTATIVLVIAVALGVLLLQRRGARLAAAPGETMKITRVTSSGQVIAAAISPDGKYVAYVHSDAGQQGLWLRQVATGSTLELIPARRRIGFWGHRFAPDGDSIYYVIRGPDDVGGTLYRMPTIGGEPKKILRFIETNVTFSPDGRRIAFVRTNFPSEGESSLVTATADGIDERVVLTKRPPESLANIFFNAPAWSRDGKVIAAAVRIGNDEAKVIAVDSAGGKERPLSEHKWSHVGAVEWLPGDRGLLMVASTSRGEREAQLWLLDPQTGSRRPVTNDLFAYRMVTLSSDGTLLLTVAADTTADIWVAALGDGEPPRKITKGKFEGMLSIASARDGAIIYNTGPGDGDLWVTDHTGAAPRQLTSDAGPDTDAVVSPDGRTIVWVGIRHGDWTLLRMNRDGSGVRELSSLRPVDSPSITPDGKWVIFSASPRGTPTLWKIPIAGGTPVELTRYHTAVPSVSPDGKWIAAYARPQADGPMVPVIIPIGGGPPAREYESTPTTLGMMRWSPDSRGIIHNVGPNDRINLWFQPLEGGPPRRITKFDDQYVLRFDVCADGKHLLVVRGVLARDAVLITNFPTSAD